MNYETYKVIKNARLAIERAEEIKKISKNDLEKKKICLFCMSEKESKKINPLIWNTIDEINYKLNELILKLITELS